MSGILGPRIISHGLVDKYGFQIYGGAGKSLLFAAIVLLLLIQRDVRTFKLRSWQLTNVGWLCLAVATFLLSWISINRLIAHSTNTSWPIFANVGIVATVTLLLPFSFGLVNLKKIYQTYKRELLLSLLMAVSFFMFLYLVYGLWAFLASTVLNAVRHLLSLVNLTAIYFPPRTLLLSKFAITVSEFCSGIDSIALFTALYALIGVLDWRRFDHKKYLIVFMPALVVLFGCNILRVFLLILGGYYINPQIAFSLFHTYAGMIFFILYSAAFWTISYRWLLTKNAKADKISL